jgi:serine/threonine protein kinase
MNLQPNDTLRQGQYLIKRIIGEGGFGITYEALHINFNHSVVIKTPNDNLQNEPDYPKFIQRFRQEGQIVFKLRHPNIVRVTDLFDENNLPCLVMEYVAGENLYDYVENNDILTEEKALKYINQIGSALQKVHELQPDNPLIHRDATPLNIMINDEDNAILIDFGIAGELQSKFSTTRAFGNPLFAPHEQWRGIKHPTIDIYTLAGSFYFCLTGKPPEFDHDGDLIEPKKLNNSISDNVNNAIIKALQFKPSLRPQTMKEWLELLENKPKNNINNQQYISLV